MSNAYETSQNLRYWRQERAEKFALIVDANGYFEALRRVVLGAREQLLLIGWDFDLEIEMFPLQSDEDGLAPDGFPNKLGPFLEEVIKQRPSLNIYMLKWNGSVLVAPGRLAPTAALAAFGSSRIHLALDSHHPFGACHHQKIVVADDDVAFCGGIDATEDRWDTSEHLPDDPRRARKNGTLSEPWHDATSAMSGPAAVALGDLSRERWKRARGEVLDSPEKTDVSIWPEDLGVDATDIDVSIARTEPPFDGADLINEIEEALLHSIRTAEHTIYIESQYFAAETIGAALEARLRETNGPEIVVINPKYALSAFEDDSMHELRHRMIKQLEAADHEGRFRMLYPVNAAGDPIYVHAKILIADGAVLHIGSANMNNRSLGFDTECNIVVENQDKMVARFQSQLLSEHLGVSQEKFAQTLTEKRSVIATLDTLNARTGRRLKLIEDREPDLRSKALADSRLMDPRYHRNENSTTGRGIRPRHIATATAIVAAGYLVWRALRKS